MVDELPVLRADERAGDAERPGKLVGAGNTKAASVVGLKSGDEREDTLHFVGAQVGVNQGLGQRCGGASAAFGECCMGSDAFALTCTPLSWADTVICAMPQTLACALWS